MFANFLIKSKSQKNCHKIEFFCVFSVKTFQRARDFMLNKTSNLKFVLFVVFAVFISNAFANTDKNLGKITGEVDISLKQEKISARLKYDYVAVGEAEPEIKFYLSENFNVTKVKCGRCSAFKFDKAQRLPTLTISLEKPLQPGDRLPIEIEYNGDLKGMYHKEHRFLELGLDWF